MKTIQEFLLEHKTTAPPRFSFPIPDTVESDLCACYRSAVEAVGRRFEDASDTRRAITSAANWFRHGRHGLLMSGKCGTGKSVLLQAVALLIKYYSGNRLTMAVFTTSDICDWSRAVEKKTDEEKFQLERLKTFRYLGLDDLGTEALTVKSWGTELSPILDTLYSRYDARKVTVITTNDSLDSLQKKYGQRLYDRICEVYDRIPFDFESFRQK